MKITKTSKSVEVTRWVVLLPGAYLAGWIAWILVHYLGKFSFMVVGIDTDSFLAKLYFNSAGNAMTGIAFVYLGC